MPRTPYWLGHRAAYAADTLFVDLDVQIFKRIDERAGTAHFEMNVYSVAVFGHHGSGNSYRLAFCDLCARFDRSRAERLIYGRYTVIVISLSVKIEPPTVVSDRGIRYISLRISISLRRTYRAK